MISEGLALPSFGPAPSDGQVTFKKELVTVTRYIAKKVT